MEEVPAARLTPTAPPLLSLPGCVMMTKASPFPPPLPALPRDAMVNENEAVKERGVQVREKRVRAEGRKRAPVEDPEDRERYEVRGCAEPKREYC